MRFFSSSALAKAPKFRFAASCSAAETMARRSEVRAPPLYGNQAADSLGSFAGARTVTEPPAFSTAATADFDAPQTEHATLAFNSPLPRRRTPSWARRNKPALI